VGEKTNVYKILVGVPKEKRLVGNTRHKWKNNIEVDVKELGWWGMDWINLAVNRDKQQAVINMVMCLLVL
jgi:hypothetical protein